jgi:UMF1 family MFS transporter
MYDWANSAFATVILAAVLPVYFASLVPAGGAPMRLFGTVHLMPAAALWGYAVAASMAVVVLLAPPLGVYADRHNRHRLLLIVFCVIGAVATALLALAGPGRYLLAALLFVVANVGFAAGNVFYNAFLPALANESELDRLSARGFALGYIGGGLMLFLAFVLIEKAHAFGFADRGAATRFSFLLTGLWWGGFALSTFLSLRPEAFIRPPGTTTSGLRGYLATLAELRGQRDLLLFLIAYLFYNDGIQTVIVVSAIFGREELKLSTGTILGAFLMIQFVAMPGALLFGRFAERFGAKRAVLVSLVCFLGVTGFAYRMHGAREFWLLGFVVALILGGSQAISRSLFATMIPAGKNAEFFSFYAISGKFASVFGPLVFAFVTSWTGSTRLAILALGVFFLVGIALLLPVNVERARQLAAAQITLSPEDGQ